MPRDTKEVVPAKAVNPFSCLAESDSEEEAISHLNQEEQENQEEKVESPPLAPLAPLEAKRTWPTPSKQGETAFSSPFSKKRWNKPRFKEDTEGWVSIRWNQPQFQDDVPSTTVTGGNHLTVQYQPRTPPFYPVQRDVQRDVDPDRESKILEDEHLYADVTPPSLDLEPLQQSVKEVVLEGTITPLGGPMGEQLTALAWAERVKKSLEKAEAARAAKGRPTDPKADEDFKEALGRLSFFRRGMVGTTSSE